MAKKRKFKVKDRVRRPYNIWAEKSIFRTGTIIASYSKTTGFYQYAELYSVEWDDGQIEKDFLPHGLEDGR